MRLAGDLAGVVELVDAPDSKSGSERSVGSTPTARTILFKLPPPSRAFGPRHLPRFAGEEKSQS